MSRKMTKVTRYKCAWCGHEFHTPDKHLCKFDPDCKNCLSCVHRGNYYPEHTEPGGQGINVGSDYFPPSFYCKALGYVCEGGLNDFPEAVTNIPASERNGCVCSLWRLIPNYKGVETFKERMVKAHNSGTKCGFLDDAGNPVKDDGESKPIEGEFAEKEGGKEEGGGDHA